MLRKVLLAVGLVVAITAVVAAVKVMQIRSMIAAGESFVMPPETVSSATVRRVQWETSLSAIGTVAAVQGVLVRSEVAGVVTRVGAESGTLAREGQVLAELDSSWDQAQLAAAEARLELARANLARARDLHSQRVLSQSELDAAEATYRQVTSEADALRVTIAKKTIRAPFTGRLGIREIQLGQYAEPGTPVVPLQALDPVHVDFSLPEQAASRLRTGLLVRVTTDAAPGLVLEGPLTAISPEVDPQTRNIKLQATLKNPDGALLPGMFVRAELVMSDVITPLVIPVTAVQRAPYGDSVFVIADVKDEKTGKVSKRVAMTTVTLAETRGDLVVVEHGLEEGQVVASSGVFKLSNGMEVVINDELAPEAEASPRPKDS